MGKQQQVYLPEDVLIPYFGKEAKIVGIEIGVFTGTGSLIMLDRLPNLKLYSIDPWHHIDGAKFEAGQPQKQNDDNYELTTNRLKVFEDRSVIIRKTSDEAINDVPGEVDFVHIDGNHDYEYINKDIKNYYPKVKKGGLISGHDFLLQIGVVRAVYEIFKNKAVFFGDDFLWWVYK